MENGFPLPFPSVPRPLPPIPLSLLTALPPSLPAPSHPCLLSSKFSIKKGKSESEHLLPELTEVIEVTQRTQRSK